VKQLAFFIAISIALHFLTTTSALYFADMASAANKNSEPTQIEIIDSSEDPLTKKIYETKQLIKQLKSNLQEIKNTKSEARFESEKTQRVEKETVASQFGQTRNAGTLSSAQNTESAKSEEKGETQKQMPEFTRSKSVYSQSTISADLPQDIARSNATNLNTDANIHYSFYSRVEDLFYVRWVEQVRFIWSRLDPNFKSSTLAGKTWSTQVEIWLKDTGEYQSGFIVRSSGYEPFDEAAVLAFKKARFFPNPPKSKVEADGLIRLRYRFNVHVISQ
jgi:TonB family protein